MEVKETNTYQKRRSQHKLDATSANSYVANFFEFLKKKADDTKRYIKREFEPLVKQWIEDFKDITSSDIKVEQVEFLTKSELIEIGRKYKVEGSTGVAAFKEMKNETFFIYLAYMNVDERVLLPREDNMYIVIESEGLSKDVKELFSDSELIILL